MFLTLKNLNKLILDTIFPIKCVGCGKTDFWICNKCLNEIHIETDYYCSICQIKSTSGGKTCLSCKKKDSLDRMIWTTNYNQPLIMKAIHLFKYRFVQDLHIPLGTLLTKTIAKAEIPIPDLIIPVPLHPRRIRWRGFNQSELLAKIVSDNLLPLHEIPIEKSVLFRQRNTKPQMELKKRNQRQQNISNAFKIKHSKLIKDKKILLIDDVSTTGSTIFECAKILKSNGADEVFAVVVAKQEISRQ